MSGNFHYTSNTVSVSKHCKKCGKVTPHRVNDNHQVGKCLVCLYKLDPRILSRDEFAMLRIPDHQRVMDIWAKQLETDRSTAQLEMFA